MWRIEIDIIYENTLSFVVTSFFDNFLSTILSSSGIRFSSSGLKGVNPKICEEMSTFVWDNAVDDNKTADRALLEG